jgi:thioredoxin reductase (NADPH)
MGDEVSISGRPRPGPGKSWAAQATSRPLTGDHIAMLRRIGEVRPVQAGEVLFREGDRGYDLFVILSGQLKITDHQAGVERDLATGGAGEFAAELSLLTGERLFTTAVVVEPGEVLVVAVARLQALISRDQALGDLIVQTFFARREWLIRARRAAHRGFAVPAGYAQAA